MPKLVDANQLAARILLTATITSPKPGESGQQRVTRATLSQAGTKRKDAMSPEERVAQAKQAAAARWRP